RTAMLPRPGRPGRAAVRAALGAALVPSPTADTMNPVQDPSRPERRRVLGRLVRPGEDAEAFDREFWRSMTGEQPPDPLSRMTLAAIAINGGNADDHPGLQRSVGRIVRP